MLAVSIIWILAGDAVREFMQVGLAGEDRACRVHRAGNISICRWQRPHLGKEGRTGERGEVGEIEEIFGEERHTTQRSVATGAAEAVRQFVFRAEPREGGPALRRRKPPRGPEMNLVRRRGRRELLPVTKCHAAIFGPSRPDATLRSCGSRTAGGCCMSSPMIPLVRVLPVCLLIVLATGCSRPERDTPALQKSGLRKVVLQTDWFPQAEHGGFYQALARGYYAEVGLAVDIWAGGPGAGIKLKVARGDADFGMLRSDDVLLAASRGLPLVMVAATLQHDPLALMLHAESPVKNFQQLAGRVVIGNVGMAWMPFLERKFGITFEKRQNPYGLGEFLANPETIQQCMVTNEPFFAQQQGRRVRTLSLAEAGYDCYHVVIARRELVRSSPEIVQAFVGASIRGWRDYLDGDPTAADDLILKRNPQTTREVLAFSRAELILRRFVHGDRAKGEDVGQLSFTRLSEQMEALLGLKVMELPVAITSVATKEFLPPVPPGW